MFQAASGLIGDGLCSSTRVMARLKSPGREASRVAGHFRLAVPVEDAAQDTVSVRLKGTRQESLRRWLAEDP